MKLPEFALRLWRYALLVLLLLGLFWGAQARAQANAPRMALLIGNSAYTGEWDELTTTINDANDLGQRLAELGWQTTVTTNRTLDNMMDDVQNFVVSAQRANAGQLLVYFAGHGLEWERGAFLIPVDLQTSEGRRVSYLALNLQRLLNELQRAPGLKLVMIDACRTRPRVRGGGGGLPTPDTQPNDVLVAYASEALQAAMDSVVRGQRNGVYASGLLSALNNVSRNGGGFNDVMADTDIEVQRISGGQQNPMQWVSALSASRFRFTVVPPAPVPPSIAIPIPTVPAPTTLSAQAPTLAPTLISMLRMNLPGFNRIPWLYALLVLLILGLVWGLRERAKANLLDDRSEVKDNILHGRYEILADGSEVKDKETGLIWARCSVGQTWDGSHCVGEAQKFTLDQAQKLASNGWRLPTVRELHSLVWSSTGETKYLVDPDGKGAIKHACAGNYISPTIRSDVFPQTPSGSYYWTSSPYVGNSGYAWGVSFGYGFVSDLSRSNYSHVRLVR